MLMQRGGIEVWTARPDRVGAAACNQLAGLLDPQESERAASFRFEADRQAFVMAHALRRLALAATIGADPSDLRFDVGPHGRPVLLGVGSHAPAFSLTRSRGLVACAVAASGPLGIDVETVRPGVAPSLLETFVTPPVPADVFDASPDVFMQWTALEAFWKARGTGLSSSQPRIGLRDLGGQDCYEIVEGDSGRGTGMVVMRLPSPGTHVLALACAEVETVQIIDFERLAPRPAGDAGDSYRTCNDDACEEAAPGGIGH
ncbi:MAG: 4'-phosphopantetheinyl transferase family protein [Ramlibacter sp.]